MLCINMPHRVNHLIFHLHIISFIITIHTYLSINRVLVTTHSLHITARTIIIYVSLLLNINTNRYSNFFVTEMSSSSNDT